MFWPTSCFGLETLDLESSRQMWKDIEIRTNSGFPSNEAGGLVALAEVEVARAILRDSTPSLIYRRWDLVPPYPLSGTPRCVKLKIERRITP